MTRLIQSPKNTRYLTALTVPQALAFKARELKTGLVRQGMIPAPMEAILPLVETAVEPRPPVTGLLPRCPAPPAVAEYIYRPGGSPWWIWPVSAGKWLEEIAEALAGEHREYRLFPGQFGIPLAASRPILRQDERDETGPGNIPGGWRAMNLQCLEIRFEDEEQWHQSLLWRTVWKRRLGRASVSTNIDKQA